MHCGSSADLSGSNGVVEINGTGGMSGVMERKDSMQAQALGSLGASLGLGVLGLIERDQRARGEGGGFWGQE